MRIIGIDYGEKRVGLAISDETETLARELEIYTPKELFAIVKRLLTEQEIGSVALGWPLNMNGQETQKTHEVGECEKKLQAITSIPIHRVDERLSTSMAHGLPGGRKNTDSLAAQIILQNYLDQKKSS